MLIQEYLDICDPVLTFDRLMGGIKLEEYVEKVHICGEGRNRYSKTDHSATFMRIKTDYMGNDQLLPAYNVQIGAADEYIAVVDVNQYRSDMDCCIPLMNKFRDIYGSYPKYPGADAGCIPCDSGPTLQFFLGSV